TPVLSGRGTRANGGAQERPPGREAGAARRGEGGERRNGRIFASPLARKMAEDEGLDLTQLEGSGPSGRIVRRDVEEALARGTGRVERATEAAGEMTRAAAAARGMTVAPAPMVEVGA